MQTAADAVAQAADVAAEAAEQVAEQAADAVVATAEAIAENAETVAAQAETLVASAIEGVNALLADPKPNLEWLHSTLRIRNVTVNDTLDALGTTLEGLNDTLGGALSLEEYDRLERRCVRVRGCVCASPVLGVGTAIAFVYQGASWPRF